MLQALRCFTSVQADSAARRAVVADLARRAGLTTGAELPEDLFFTGHDHGKRRPDIVGVDDSARARIVSQMKVAPALRLRHDYPEPFFPKVSRE